jgi:hypothetical protein
MGDGMIDLTDRANLIEVVAVLVDAMRRADPAWCVLHDCEVVNDEDWDTAIAAGEDVLEAAEVEF